MSSDNTSKAEISIRGKEIRKLSRDTQKNSKNISDRCNLGRAVGTTTS